MSDVASKTTQEERPERVTRCVILQAAGEAEPTDLLEALQRKPVRIELAHTPARAMAEIARHEIEFRHRAEKAAHRLAEEKRTGRTAEDAPAEDPREPLVLLAIDPEAFNGEAERMSGSVAHYFPQVVQWIYETGDEPRLEPWLHAGNETLNESRDKPRPSVETRSTRPAPIAPSARPSLRLTSTEEEVEQDSIGLDHERDQQDSVDFDDGIDDSFGPPPLDPPAEFASPGTDPTTDEAVDEDVDDLDEDLAPPLVSPDELAMLLDDDDDDEDEDDGNGGGFHGGMKR